MAKITIVRGHAEDNSSCPRSGPRTILRGRDRGQNFGLEASLSSRTNITGCQCLHHTHYVGDLCGRTSATLFEVQQYASV